MDNGHDAHQTQITTAQGIVAEQANCALDQALALMQNTAQATDATLHFIAGEIIAGRVRFDES